MNEHVLIVGLDELESADIRARVGATIIAHEVLPKIAVLKGQLFVQQRNSIGLIPVSRVVFHGIFENDLDFIAGLALWDGPCLPNAQAMMDCRLKLPCLVRALKYTRFGAPARGYAGPGTTIEVEDEHVAKWGKWHYSENKSRFTGSWTSEQASVIEPFLSGQAVRVVIIGDHYWQIKLEGDEWRKSIHDPKAALMDIDPDLLADTQHIQQAFGLEIIANDYIVTESGSKHLLEVNYIPIVTRFPEIWTAYRDYVVQWINAPVI